LSARALPCPALIYLPYIGLSYAHFFNGRFADAASAAARASAVNPRFTVPRYLHAAALVRLGRIQEAKSIAEVVLEVQPGFTINGLITERSRALSEWRCSQPRCVRQGCRSDRLRHPPLQVAKSEPSTAASGAFYLSGGGGGIVRHPGPLPSPTTIVGYQPR